MTIFDVPEDPLQFPDEAEQTTENEPLCLSPADPLTSAKAFRNKRYYQQWCPVLHHHANAFYAWDGTCYPEVNDAALRSELYGFLEKAVRPVGKDIKPFMPTTSKVSNVLDALKATAHLGSGICAPAWLSNPPRSAPPPSEILACRNGLLHLPTLNLLPHTPAFFSHNSLSFEYDPATPEPGSWLKFLSDIWPEDPESVETLQDVFGYLLAPDTSQQKLFLIVGPKRSGKGTIARVLTELMGNANVCSPTLSSLGQNFGLQPLINKSLAIIADARLSSRADQSAIAERLLSISGEDGLTIDRKYAEHWFGRLPTRFLVLSNELPRVGDVSGALASRFIVLTMEHSFFGQEDLSLQQRLLDELPGILNWSIQGWQRLQQRGHFNQPAAAQDAVAELEDLGSPISAFIRDRCEVAPGKTVSCDVLFREWQSWCSDQGRTQPGTAQSFGRDLRAAVSGLKMTHRRESGSRLRHYEGIGLAL